MQATLSRYFCLAHALVSLNVVPRESGATARKAAFLPLLGMAVGRVAIKIKPITLELLNYANIPFLDFLLVLLFYHWFLWVFWVDNVVKCKE
jgi:hypothetical protein